MNALFRLVVVSQHLCDDIRRPSCRVRSTTEFIFGQGAFVSFGLDELREVRIVLARRARPFCGKQTSSRFLDKFHALLFSGDEMSAGTIAALAQDIDVPAEI